MYFLMWMFISVVRYVCERAGSLGLSSVPGSAQVFVLGVMGPARSSLFKRPLTLPARSSRSSVSTRYSLLTAPSTLYHLDEVTGLLNSMLTEAL